MDDEAPEQPEQPEGEPLDGRLNEEAPPKAKSPKAKMAAIAALAVLITVSSFVGGWMASEKSRAPRSKPAAEGTPGANDDMGKSFKAIIDDPGKAGKGKAGGEERELSIDEQIAAINKQLAEIDFSDSQGRIKGNSLLAQKVALQGKREKEKMHDEDEEVIQEREKQRQLEQSVKNWVKRTD